MEKRVKYEVDFSNGNVFYSGHWVESEFHVRKEIT